jgi:hypothetical protein
MRGTLFLFGVYLEEDCSGTRAPIPDVAVWALNQSSDTRPFVMSIQPVVYASERRRADHIRLLQQYVAAFYHELIQALFLRGTRLLLLAVTVILFIINPRTTHVPCPYETYSSKFLANKSEDALHHYERAAKTEDQKASIYQVS